MSYADHVVQGLDFIVDAKETSREAVEHILDAKTCVLLLVTDRDWTAIVGLCSETGAQRRRTPSWAISMARLAMRTPADRVVRRVQTTWAAAAVHSHQSRVVHSSSRARVAATRRYRGAAHACNVAGLSPLERRDDFRLTSPNSRTTNAPSPSPMNTGMSSCIVHERSSA